MKFRYYRSAPVLFALLATFGIASTVQSQASSPARKGFYISASGAYGSADVTSSTVSLPSDFKTGVAGYFALGWTLKPQWRLGFQVNAYQKSFQGETVTLAFYSASASFYPSLNNNLWLKGNLGMANVTNEAGGTSTSESGFAAGIGIGYDWLPGHGKFAIIPYASYSAQLSGGEFSQSPGVSFKGSLFQVGVGIGYKH